MKSSTSVTTVGVFLFVGVIVKSSVDALDVKCKGIDIKVQEEHMMSIKDCMTNAGVEKLTDLTAAKAGCFAKCIMEKYNLIDPSGKPHKENIMNAMDKNLPPEVVGEWKVEMGKCLDNEGSQIKSPDDAACSSYLPMTMCMHMTFFKVCNT